ncbi:MAG: DUF1156 domain-containing protein [Candidatus Desulfofervidaceae bacterium]|nr:DUF1156 domain-containing protein [Candidatus Desulfofervidaceae bacterium]
MSQSTFIDSELTFNTKPKKAIEINFPIFFVSELAERESWRKEIYRPPYYIHKWWARRLGSVFRALIIGALSNSNIDIADLYYKPYKMMNFKNKVIYDPFMGSGVTIGEAIKLGCRVIGRDINPISFFMVKTSLQDYDWNEVYQCYKAIEQDVSNIIKDYYKAIYKDKTIDVLYYFWVKVVKCPKCNRDIDLFTSRIFARHAYPQKHPEVKTMCPVCGEINDAKITDTETECKSCGTRYEIHKGNIQKGIVTCPHCNYKFALIDQMKNMASPPKHRLYAKLVLTENGDKVYLKADQFDIELYEKASQELKTGNYPIPMVKIVQGYNTNQVINYGYTHWHQFFNDRQLLVLSILAQRIKKIKSTPLRYLFTCLFSGILEFNNMFCSYKGEGTGAVRPLFSHHILKPEMMPIEANMWGTHKSSGSFMTLFQTRIKRAIKYRENPFELRLFNGKTKKIYNINKDLNVEIAYTFDDFIKKHSDVYISCGSSDSVDIEDKTVDAVITDPPFFDNVNYSELADFFYSWIRFILKDDKYYKQETTRSEKEVQDSSHENFSEKLKNVFAETYRVLKDDGILVFTYSHSKDAGWLALIKALHKSNFYIVATYPVKSEMSVAIPKQLSKEPINYDIIIVARKRPENNIKYEIPKSLITDALIKVDKTTCEFKRMGYKLSKNDIKIFLMAEIIKMLSRVGNLSVIEDYLTSINGCINEIVDEIYEKYLSK